MHVCMQICILCTHGVWALTVCYEFLFLSRPNFFSLSAIGAMFARNGHSVVMLDRNEDRVRCINETHFNPSYLKDVELPHTLTATTDASVAFQGVMLCRRFFFCFRCRKDPAVQHTRGCFIFHPQILILYFMPFPSKRLGTICRRSRPTSPRISRLCLCLKEFIATRCNS
jgi:hypothetical protein